MTERETAAMIRRYRESAREELKATGWLSVHAQDFLDMTNYYEVQLDELRIRKGNGAASEYLRRFK